MMGLARFTGHSYLWHWDIKVISYFTFSQSFHTQEFNIKTGLTEQELELPYLSSDQIWLWFSRSCVIPAGLVILPMNVITLIFLLVLKNYYIVTDREKGRKHKVHLVRWRDPETVKVCKFWKLENLTPQGGSLMQVTGSWSKNWLVLPFLGLNVTATHSSGAV